MVGVAFIERHPDCFSFRVDHYTQRSMERPKQFEEHQWVGDKRTQIVYDVDRLADESLIRELMEAGTYLCFGPDTLAEARNRGYRPYQGNGYGTE